MRYTSLFKLADYFSIWCIVFIVFSIVTQKTDPYYVILFLFYANIFILLVKVILWKQQYEPTYLAFSIFIHSVWYLIQMKPSRYASQNFFLLIGIYLAYVIGRNKNLVEIYKKSPTKWSNTIINRIVSF